MEALFKTGGGGGHDREMLGMPGRARWRGQTQAHPATSTVLFSLGAKMLCNRIAQAIAGDSIAALRRPVLSGQRWNLFLGPVKWWFPRKGQSSDHPTPADRLSRVSRLILDSPKLPRSHVRVVIDSQALHRHLQHKRRQGHDGPRTRTDLASSRGVCGTAPVEEKRRPPSWPRES